MCRTAPHTRQTEHCETPLTAQAFERHGQKTAAHRPIDSIVTVRRDQVARIAPKIQRIIPAKRLPALTQ